MSAVIYIYIYSVKLFISCFFLDFWETLDVTWTLVMCAYEAPTAWYKVLNTLNPLWEAWDSNVFSSHSCVDSANSEWHFHPQGWCFSTCTDAATCGDDISIHVITIILSLRWWSLDILKKKRGKYIWVSEEGNRENIGVKTLVCGQICVNTVNEGFNGRLTWDL